MLKKLQIITQISGKLYHTEITDQQYGTRIIQPNKFKTIFLPKIIELQQERLTLLLNQNKHRTLNVFQRS